MSEENNEVNEAVQQVEKEARLMGWVDKSEYRDGEHWVDAETFVKRGKEINPILRKNNETLLKKLEESQREIAEVKKVASEFQKFQKEQAERKVKSIETELAALREEKKAAISAGDGEKAVGIDDQIDALKEEKKEAAKAPAKEAPPAAAALDPIIVDWMAENEWFTSDTKYTRIADAIGMEINQKFPELSGKKFFEKLDEELAEVLPEKYKKTPRRTPVESGSTTTGGTRGTKNKQSYDHLPADAKAACDKYVKTIPGYTREQYVADYDWS